MTALKIDAKFEEKLTCAFKNNMRNLTNFHRLKNSDFILGGSQSKQPDRSDAVWKLCFTLEINEYTTNKTFYRYSCVHTGKFPRKLSSWVVFFNIQYIFSEDLMKVSQKSV